MVEINRKGIAEIYSIDIHEPHRGKGYGSKLWLFAEAYVIKKYHPERFIGELNIGTTPKIADFWKSLDFQIKYKDSSLAYALKEVGKKREKGFS